MHDILIVSLFYVPWASTLFHPIAGFYVTTTFLTLHYTYRAFNRKQFKINEV